jgi:radical SAM superfamily enzyme YgiQ (UPF0313 family)
MSATFAKPQAVKARSTIYLITALTVVDFIDPELTTEAHANTGAQLGVLTLAALLREQGYEPIVLNLDNLFYDFVRRDKSHSSTDEFFFPFVVEQFGSISCDIIGLSSICSSYPLTLRLAQEARRTNPYAKIILGGPQASVVDVPTLQAFPCIDIIVRGEADDTFPALLHLLDSDNCWEELSGITFRRGGDVIRNQNALVVADLNRLPLPAFDLDSKIQDRGGIHLEIGRGCPFACTFCSTNDFFRRNFRLKSPERMIADISALKKEYGIEYFSLVHDMYTIDRKKVVAFCEAILQSGEKFTWGCSARTDCIDDELIALMAQAGCTGIFFGIETGSQRLQHVINKKLDLSEAVKRIECADRHGVKTAVALIAGFPEETRDDLRDTIHFFIDSLRFGKAEPQCSLLAPLAATPIFEQHKHHLVFDYIYSDISNQSWRQDPVEVELIKEHPDIFPSFYSISTVVLERAYVRDVTDFVTYLATWFRWLPVSLLQDSGDMLKVFDRWQQWRAERKPSDTDEDNGWIPYYSHRRFRNEFLEFVQTCYLKEMATAHAPIAALVQTENASLGCLSQCDSDSSSDENGLNGDCVPCQRSDLVMAEITVDYHELIETLRNNADLSRVPKRDTTIIFNLEGREVKVWQLAPLSANLLRLCDGKRTVNEIVTEFSQPRFRVEGVPPEKVCLFGLMQLKQDGIIGFSSSPISTRKNEGTEYTTYSFPPKSSNTQQPWPPLSVEKV